MAENYKHILEYDGLIKVINDYPASVIGVSIDSRTLNPGNIFFCLVTENADGHYYISKAIDKGASVIIANEAWAENQSELSGNICYLIVDDSLKALQDMAAIHRQLFEIPVIGITGSNGKTTTKEMLAHILEDELSILKNPGNFNNHLGVPLTLFQLREDHDLAIVEMGTNHAGEIRRLCEIADPTSGTVTNIGNAHVGNFSSFEKLVEEKTSLLTYLENKKGTIVLNTFDPQLAKMDFSAATIEIGPAPANDLYSNKVHLLSDKNGISFDLNSELIVELPVPGYHNRTNAMLAIALARQFGVSVAKSVEKLATFKSAEQRMEFLSVNGITILNDCYNASPESMKEAIIYVQEFANDQDRPLLLILGDMLELGTKSEDFHGRIHEFLLEDSIHSMWLAGKSMVALAKKIEDGHFPDGLHYAIEPELWLTDLLERIPGNAVILIKASRGMHLEQVVSAILSRKG